MRGTAALTVGPPDLVSVTMQPSQATVKRGATVQLSLIGYSNNTRCWRTARS